MSDQAHTKQGLAGLTLAALGVVYGDIGTSPLYTLKECFTAHAGVSLEPANIYGVLSLIFWAIMLVVSVKYVLFVMRADNKGEGGMMALMALANRHVSAKTRWYLVVLGIFGTSLFYGDAVITPAISVLSAVEGLKVLAPGLEAYVLPISLAVIVGLFLIQRHGTAKVGTLFGPIILVWFSTLAVIGALGILKHPGVLVAVNPLFGLEFLLMHQKLGFFVLGSVVLAVTGGEALYADMGHFGAKPIRYAWFGLVLPALLLNYFGQGALLLDNPKTLENPFFHLAPTWGLLPLIVLATLATVIASQAVISGAFSLTRQAVLLGYIPRVTITHTSEHEIGQIYIPIVNWLLLAAVVTVVLMFQSSSSLAAAYGIAVTGTMLITTLLAFIVARNNWHWPLPAALALCSVFAIVDIAFFSANLLKLFQGGWLPLVIGFALFVLMTTWRKGRELVFERMSELAIPLDGFVEGLEAYPPTRVEGTSVFMTSTSKGVPSALLHNLKHNKILHERVVLMTIRTQDEPFVRQAERVKISRMSNSFWRVEAFYGFKEAPDVHEVLELCGQQGLHFELMETSFFLSRETLISTERPGMARWREKLFVWMSKNALRATDFFQVPTNRVVELGAQIEL
jgi:KUP system potassium uptake protein